MRSFAVCCLASFLLIPSAAAQLNSAYANIASRNVFRLKDPPPPPQPFLPSQPKASPKLTLTGIADFSTAKWAFVTRTDPGQPPKSYTLTDRQAQGGLQLIHVNANAATATLIVDGTETVTLPLASPTNNPAKPPPSFPATRLTRR